MGMEFPAAFENPTGSETPKKETPPKSATRQTGGRQAPLQGRLFETISMVGIMVAALNEVDGLAILNGAERLSEALDKAAKQNPAVRRALEAALSGTVWGEVIFASGAIAVPIAINHGMLPSGLMNRVAPMEGMPSENGNGPQHSE